MRSNRVLPSPLLMIDSQKKKQTKPGLLSWSFAFLSLLFGAGLVFSILFISIDIRAFIAYKNMHRLLSEQVWAPDDLARYLEQVNSRKSYIAWLYFVPDPLSRIPAQINSKIYELLRLSYERQEQSSIGQIDELISQIETLPEYAAAIQRSPKLRTSVITLKKTLRSYESARSDVELIGAALKIKREQLLGQIKQHSLIAGELSSLFNLSPAYKTKGRDRLLAYQSGLLKDLPILEGLPDEINTYEDLNNRVVAQGGTISEDGGTREFTLPEKLAQLRQTCAAITEKSSQLRDEIDELLDNQSTLKVRIDTDRESLKKTLYSLLVYISEPLFSVTQKLCKIKSLPRLCIQISD